MKHIFNISIIAASLFVGGAAIAAPSAPQTGPLAISGKLITAPCTVSVPSDLTFGNLTVAGINAAADGTVLKRVSAGKFTFTGCEAKGISMVLINSGGTFSNSLKGKFKFAQGDANNPPVYLEAYAADDSNTPIPLNGDGNTLIKDIAPWGMNVAVVKNGANKADDFAGNFDTTLTVNYAYR